MYESFGGLGVVSREKRTLFSTVSRRLRVRRKIARGDFPVITSSHSSDKQIYNTSGIIPVEKRMFLIYTLIQIARFRDASSSSAMPLVKCTHALFPLVYVIKRCSVDNLAIIQIISARNIIFAILLLTIKLDKKF